MPCLYYTGNLNLFNSRDEEKGMVLLLILLIVVGLHNR